MLTEQLEEDLAALADETSIDAAESILKQRRTALTKEHVTVTRVDGGGIPIDVTREVAEGLLSRGTHRVA